MALNKTKEKDTPKERLIKGVALSDDELEKVSGGIGGLLQCPVCGQLLRIEIYESHCSTCGKDWSDLGGFMRM